MSTQARLPGRPVELWPEEEREPERRSPGPYIEVWQDDTSFWQWMYFGTEDGTRLPSNRRYVSKEEAFASARVAYPNVSVREASRPVRRPRRRRLPWLVLLALLALIGLGVLIAVAASLAAVIFFVRRGRVAVRTRTGSRDPISREPK